MSRKKPAKKIQPPKGKASGFYSFDSIEIKLSPPDEPIPYRLPVGDWTKPPPAPPPFMSTDSATRKLMPVATGVLQYFPDALLCVSWISRAGNDKHNPGQPLHWAKEKSTDEPDCEVRHMLDHFRGVAPDPGLEPLGELGHLASKAWRALAHLQRACDAERARVKS